MSDYIDREAVLDLALTGKIISNCNYKNVCKLIKGIPSEDVRPVVRGAWKPQDLTWGRSFYCCSACEEMVDMPTAMGIPMFRYCPNCGAKMEES